MSLICAILLFFFELLFYFNWYQLDHGNTYGAFGCVSPINLACHRDVPPMSQPVRNCFIPIKKGVMAALSNRKIKSNKLKNFKRKENLTGGEEGL